VAVIEVGLFTVKLVAALAPTITAVAPVKLVPVMTTVVPPPVDPEVGLRPVTAGAGGGAPGPVVKAATTATHGAELKSIHCGAAAVAGALHCHSAP